MLIKLNKDRTLSGPNGTIYGGRTAEVPEATGRDLIAGGYAVEVVAVPVQPTVAGAVETATAPRAPETATVPKRLDTTPGGISTVNSEAALVLIAAAATAEELDSLEAAEKASEKHTDGRKGVLTAIAERREELADKGKAGK